LTKVSRQFPDGLHLVSQALEGDRRATARLLTLVENGHPEGQAALAELYPRSGRAHVIGFTGSTGTGKSTLVNEVVREFRERGLEVGVVAVDPTSPFSGGALLGDRLRMRDMAGDPGVFIRSMASRGDPGGLAQATREVVTVLDALGFPVILVETVGAGQVQVEVSHIVHTVILVEAPGMGDDVQALKAGLMEIADIIVVNKADRPEVHRTVQAIRGALLRATGPDEQQDDVGWAVPVLETSALERRGIDSLVEAVVAHRAYLESSGEWERLEIRRARSEVEAWLQRYLQVWLSERLDGARVDAAAATVLRHERDPASVARELLKAALGRSDPVP
jgi:LAO/AO transport system kinase